MPPDDSSIRSKGRASNPHGHGSPRTSQPEAFAFTQTTAGNTLLDTRGIDGYPVMPQLPSYIKPLPRTLGPEELRYISSKGTFEMPSQQFWGACLAGFVEFAHPQLPILNLGQFLADLDTNRGSVSLLLFHAVVFAGVAFVDLDVVQKAGYPSKMAARTAFYHKCKVLHDLNAEPDRVSSIQAVLLQSTWFDKPEDQKDPGYWTGIALTLACSIELHLEQAHEDANDSRQSLRRRLWWSCFVREQIVNFGMARPARISDYSTSMLTLSDFNFSCNARETGLRPSTPRDATDARTHQALASVFIEKAKLCIIIGHLTSVVFVNHHSGGRKGQNPRLDPDRPDQDLEICGKELEDWVGALRPEVVCTGSNIEELLQTEDRALVVIKAMLRLDYLAALGVLNRPRALREGMARGLGENEMEAMPQRIAREAAAEISTITLALHEFGLVAYFSATAVPVLVGAMITQLLAARTAETSRSASAIRDFHRCMTILRLLGITYNTAVHAVGLLERAAQALGIHDSESQIPSDKDERNIRDSRMDADNGKTFTIPTSHAMAGNITNEFLPQSRMNSPQPLLQRTRLPSGGQDAAYGSPLTFGLEGAAHGDFWPTETPHPQHGNGIMSGERTMNNILGLHFPEDFFEFLEL